MLNDIMTSSGRVLDINYPYSELGRISNMFILGNLWPVKFVGFI